MEEQNGQEGLETEVSQQNQDNPESHVSQEDGRVEAGNQTGIQVENQVRNYVESLVGSKTDIKDWKQSDQSADQSEIFDENLKETQGEQENPNRNSKEEKMFVHEIYDRLPFTYKGVDRFIKIMIGVTIAVLIFAILTSNR